MSLFVLIVITLNLTAGTLIVESPKEGLPAKAKIELERSEWLKTEKKDFSQRLFSEGVLSLGFQETKVEEENTILSGEVIFSNVNLKELKFNDHIKLQIETIGKSSKTKTQKSLAFIKTEFSKDRKWFYILVGVLSLATAVLFIFVYKHLQSQKNKKKREQLLRSFVDASTIEDYYQVWKRRQAFYLSFPEYEKNLRAFLEVLNEHQFKKEISADNKKEMIREFKKFKQGLKEFYARV